MSAQREFSHITVTTTPLKRKIDEEAKKSDLEIEKDAGVAFKCADRFNYNTNVHRKVTLSDRFELAALGFEMKAKQSFCEDEADPENYIYRKERKQDLYAAPPLPAGMSPQNPLPAGRGFISPPANVATGNAFVYNHCSRRSTPQKSTSPSAVIRPPNKPVFDDIPTNFV